MIVFGGKEFKREMHYKKRKRVRGKDMMLRKEGEAGFVQGVKLHPAQTLV